MRRASWTAFVAHSAKEAAARERTIEEAISPAQRAEAVFELSLRMPWGANAPQQRLTDLLRAMNAKGAEYLIVGAYAFAFHARPRATKGVDIFVGSDPANAQKVWNVLRAFVAPLEDLRLTDLASPGTFFIMGRPPNQIDIITSIDP